MASSRAGDLCAGEGRLGSARLDRVTLAAADELTLKSALLTAWRNVAPA